MCGMRIERKEKRIKRMGGMRKNKEREEERKTQASLLLSFLHLVTMFEVTRKRKFLDIENNNKIVYLIQEP